MVSVDSVAGFIFNFLLLCCGEGKSSFLNETTSVFDMFQKRILSRQALPTHPPPDYSNQTE